MTAADNRGTAHRRPRGTQRLAVLRYIAIHGPSHGNEIADALGIHAGTAGARRGELERAGLVFDTGRTRLTQSGMPAELYAVTDAGRAVLAAPDPARRLAGLVLNPDKGNKPPTRRKLTQLLAELVTAFDSPRGPERSAELIAIVERARSITEGTT